MGIKHDGGDKIFDPVMDELLERKEQVGDEVIQRVASKLIEGLLELGWDNADGWPGIYDSEPAVIAAFKEHGIPLKCMSEHAEHGGICEEERGHYPATDHRDDQGWTWRDEEAVQ